MTRDPLLAGLNPEQREAVLTERGPLLIFAGAGSGKTRVICHRIAYKIAAAGVRPHEVLGVTFTNKAAREMRERVEALVGRPCRDIRLATFHSAAVRILRRHYHEIGGDNDFTIYDEDDQKRLLKELLPSLGIDPKVERSDFFRDRIDRAKDDLLTPDAWYEAQRDLSPQAEKFFAVYREYEKRLHKNRALDFGGLLTETVRLFEEVPDLLDRFRRRFREILVDEFQDTNRAQYALVRLLAGPVEERETGEVRPDGAGLAVVGDDDQSIYAWRGARVEHILHDFRNDYPGAKVVVLTRNYRSRPPILEAASRLIAHNPSRPREKAEAGYLVPVRRGGESVRVVTRETEYEEAEWIAGEVERLARKERRPWSDFAVFYRVHALSRVLEEIFSTRRLPYQIAGGLSFYQRAEVKDLLAYARILVNPADEVSLRRVVGVTKGLGATSMDHLAAFAESRGITVGEALRRIEEVEKLRGPARRGFARLFLLLNRLRKEMAPRAEEGKRRSDGLGAAGVLREILDRTGYLERYDPNDGDDEARIENCYELISAAEEHEAASDDPSLAAFLENVSLATDVDEWDPTADKVTLASAHAAKGLEFGVVFVAGLEEGLFPHARVYHGVEGDRDLEEERRLAYVAMTRAKDRLYLCHAETRRLYGDVQSRTRSRFLEEAGLVEAAGGLARAGKGFSESLPVARRPARAGRAARSESAPRGLSDDDLLEGDRVRHRKFGVGVVLGVEGTGKDAVATVRFRNGTKKLLLRYAGLVRPEA